MSIHSTSAQDRFLRRTFCFLLVAALLLATAHRLPAPISEIPESPTPAPEQPAKPKPTVKPKANENSKSSTKRQTPSPTPQSKATPQRNPFDGTWIGTLNNLPWLGNTEFTFLISASGTSITEKSKQMGTKPYQAACEGSTMRWTAEANCAWTFTPNPDGKTALATINCPGLFGIGIYNSPTIFRRTSQRSERLLCFLLSHFF
jgi:hypothetical protein